MMSWLGCDCWSWVVYVSIAVGSLWYAKLATFKKANVHRTFTDAEFKAHGFGPLPSTASGGDLYLDVMKRAILNIIYVEMCHPLHRWNGKTFKMVSQVTLKDKELGEDSGTGSLTMIGLRRLNNIQECVETVVKEGIPGHLIETGSLRGGATVFMRACLRALNVKDRNVYVCDTFGKDPGHPQSFIHHLISYPILIAVWLISYIPSITLVRWLVLKVFSMHFAISSDNPDMILLGKMMMRNMLTFQRDARSQPLGGSVESVKSHFARFGLLDKQVKLLKGFFADTIPECKELQEDGGKNKIAVLRADGDTYESTIDAFNLLYEKLSPGGFCIVDDYWSLAECRRAVDEYRERHGIKEKIIKIDNLSVYWRKAK